MGNAKIWAHSVSDGFAALAGGVRQGCARSSNNRWNRSGGGGGFGSPLDREFAAVERDVRCGYVTVPAAEKYYGVVFRPGTTGVDIAASDLLRAEMRALGLPHDEPIATPAVPPPTAPEHAHHEHERLTDEERLVLAMSCRCCS